MIVDFSAFSNVRRKPRENGPNSIPKQTANPLDTNLAEQPSPLHEPTDASELDRIQILDLHTSNPLISYQSQLYTCDWTTTIGTDIILSPTAPGPSSPLLCTTRYKLLARPARLTPNVGAASASPSSSTLPSNSADSCLTPNAVVDLPPSSRAKIPKPVIAPLDTRASLGSQRQTAFLERLTAAKVARGENDQVTMHSQRRFTGSGWRSQQKQAATEEAEIEADAGAEAEAEAVAEAVAEADAQAGAAADADNMEVVPLAVEENGQESSKQGRTQNPRRAKIGRPRGRGRGRGRTRDSLFGNPSPNSADVLSAANPITSSATNVDETERAPQQVVQPADQQGALARPPAQRRAEESQGMVSSSAIVQTTTDATAIGEDVIM